MNIEELVGAFVRLRWSDGSAVQGIVTAQDGFLLLRYGPARLDSLRHVGIGTTEALYPWVAEGELEVLRERRS